MWSLSSTEAVSIINFDQLIKLVKVYNYNVTCLSGGGGLWHRVYIFQAAETERVMNRLRFRKLS